MASLKTGPNEESLLFETLEYLQPRHATYLFQMIESVI